MPKIAGDVGVHHDTIYKELRRCGAAERYDPDTAQADADKKRKNQNNFPPDSQIFGDAALAQRVSDLILKDGLNVQQVIESLQEEDSGSFRRLPKSKNTIFSAIDNGLIPGVTREALKPKTVKILSDNLLHIPQWAMQELGLRGGDVFSITVTERGIVLEKLE